MRKIEPAVPPPSPFPLNEAVPVGGFLMTLRLEEPTLFSSGLQGLEGMPVHVQMNKPVLLLLSVQNTTDRVLRYANRSHEAEYQVEVRGGSRSRARVGGVGSAEQVPVKEILQTQTPFTAYGAALYKQSILPSALLLAAQPLPVQLQLWVVNYYTPYGKRFYDEIAPGESAGFHIAVDLLYDLSISGLYRMSVRHLFPVQQFDGEDEMVWRKYETAASRYEMVPKVCEVAVSNSIDVLIMRDAVSSCLRARTERGNSDTIRLL